MERIKRVRIFALMLIALISVSANAGVVDKLSADQILSSNSVVICCDKVLGQHVVITRLPNDEVAINLINTDNMEKKEVILSRVITARKNKHGINIFGFTPDRDQVNLFVIEVKDVDYLRCSVRVSSGGNDIVKEFFDAGSVGFGNNLNEVDYSNSSYENKMNVVENSSKCVNYLKKWVEQIPANK